MGSLEKNVYLFLQKKVVPGAKLLLALSGGPDSLCLAHILKNLQKKLSFALHVAHVDHACREESLQEQEILRKWACDHHLAFHSHRINQTYTKNLEESFRKERFCFFKDLQAKENFFAIILGHHQNDLEETVLKRVLEGASVEKINALSQESQIDSLKIWRPCLKNTKKEILNYIARKKLEPFIDPTNFDKSNLRSKMREQIIPTLEKQFGKNVRSSLLKLAHFSEEYTQYMESRVDLKKILHVSNFGALFDFSAVNYHLFEIRYALKKGLEKMSISLSSQQLLSVALWVNEKKSEKKLALGSHMLYFDKARLMIFDENESQLEVCEGLPRGEKKLTQIEDWKDFFKHNGKILVQSLKNKKLRLGNVAEDRLEGGKRLKDFYKERKIPLCIAKKLPVVENSENCVSPFVVDKKSSEVSQNFSENIFLDQKKD